MTARARHLVLITIVGAFSFFGGTLFAQNAYEAQAIIAGKLDASMKLLLAAPPSPTVQSQGNADIIHVFIRGDVPRAASVIERNGGRVGTRLNGILTAQIPRSSIMQVALDPSVERIEASAILVPTDDSLKSDIRADAAHAGSAPLPQGYTGKGVIIGIIDTGIDIDHLEFRNRSDTSRSRILSVWSQRITTGTPPAGFNYGTEWTSEIIEQEIDGIPAGLINKPRLSTTHGTHVTGIAAGVRGMAPDADIIFVQPTSSDGKAHTFASTLLDGAQYIFEKARQLGRPCVINLSMSDVIHPHDGSDLFSQALDQLIAEQNGRVFCASVGNTGEGSDGRHWGGFQVGADSNWTYLLPFGRWYMRLPDSDLPTLQFSVVADSSTQAPRFIGQTPWRTVADIRNSSSPIIDTIYYSRERKDIAGTITITTASLGNGYSELLMQGDFQSFDRLRMNVRGSGTFHMWSSLFIAHPDLELYKWATDDGYRAVDTLFDIGRPAIAHNVIGVGSSINRVSYIDSKGQSHTNSSRGVSGQLSGFSTRGPAVDGRIKPDIVAPGEYVIAARSRYEDNPALLWQSDTTMLILSGTSMSTPATAGAVALYLEKNPSANFSEVRQAIISTARQDAFTASHGAIPNGHWGHGKLDIFAALAQSNSGVATDTDNDQQTRAASIFSNPATGECMLGMNISRNSDVSIMLADMSGEEAFCMNLGRFERGRYSLPLELGHLAQGTYIYRIDAGGGIHTGTVQIVR